MASPSAPWLAYLLLAPLATAALIWLLPAPQHARRIALAGGCSPWP